MENRLYFLMGLPRSGKSTIARRWLDLAADINEKGEILFNEKTNVIYPRVVVSGDTVRLALTGDRFNSLAEEFVRSIKCIMARTLYYDGYDVLVDDTNTTAASIAPLLDIDSKAIACVINTPFGECARRALETQQADLLPVLRRLNNQLQAAIETGLVEQLRTQVLPTKRV